MTRDPRRNPRFPDENTMRALSGRFGRLRGEDLLVVRDFFFDKGWIKAKLPLEKIVDQSFLQ